MGLDCANDLIFDFQLLRFLSLFLFNFSYNPIFFDPNIVVVRGRAWIAEIAGQAGTSHLTAFQFSSYFTCYLAFLLISPAILLSCLFLFVLTSFALLPFAMSSIQYNFSICRSALCLCGFFTEFCILVNVDKELERLCGSTIERTRVKSEW